MKTTPNGAGTRAAKTPQAPIPSYEPSGPDVNGMEVLLGYGNDHWGKAIGFFKGRLVQFEARYAEREVRPLTLREAARACEALINLGKSTALDSISFHDTAQEKFFRMVAAALR